MGGVRGAACGRAMGRHFEMRSGRCVIYKGEWIMEGGGMRNSEIRYARVMRDVGWMREGTRREGGRAEGEMGKVGWMGKGGGGRSALATMMLC